MCTGRESRKPQGDHTLCGNRVLTEQMSCFNTIRQALFLGRLSRPCCFKPQPEPPQVHESFIGHQIRVQGSSRHGLLVEPTGISNASTTVVEATRLKFGAGPRNFQCLQCRKRRVRPCQPAAERPASVPFVGRADNILKRHY